MLAETILNKWEIRCKHTPETIDKLVLNFRKRYMMLNSLSYKKINDFEAICHIEFEESASASSRIYSNMLRLEDVIDIKRQS
jgi:acetolactate synthase II small subunit